MGILLVVVQESPCEFLTDHEESIGLLHDLILDLSEDLVLKLHEVAIDHAFKRLCLLLVDHIFDHLYVDVLDATANAIVSLAWLSVWAIPFLRE